MLHDVPPPSPPSSTGSSGAYSDARPSILVVLQPSTDRLWHESELESPPASTPAMVPTKKRTSESCMSKSCTQIEYHGGAAPVQLLTQYQDKNVITACLDKVLENQKAAAIMVLKLMKVMNTQTQDSCIPTSITRRTRKRTIECVAADSRNADKENVSLNCHYGSLTVTPATVTGKRICQEKTGTDWQTVLDVIKYGEEQQSRQKKVVAMEEE
ncbi:hypothetical protein DFH29DRAFT_997852 [Suillus ampliporus]|nr:hypothetical protein DFH29DRAFT_997852 [Suillus ampliporus]